MATPHVLATDAGAHAFAQGGNALDAALAAATMLAVVYPHQCSPGGDLFAVVARPGGRLTAVNGSGAAPRSIDPDDLRSRAPTMPQGGPLSITVPGAVAAWEALGRLGARLGLSAALASAAEAAGDGAPVAPGLARAIAGLATRVDMDPGMAEIFLPSGDPLDEGQTLRQPALAQTLQALAKGGAEVLYRGDTGRLLLDGLRRAGSPLSLEDLALHETEEIRPLRGRYRDFEIHTAPPNSQGFVLLQLLSALDLLGSDPDSLAETARVLAELFRLASEDRDRFLCDPRRHPVPLDRLLGRDHIQDLASAAGEAAAGIGAEGLPSGRRGEVAGTRGSPDATEPPTHSGDTVAVVAMDAEGYAVSLIQSVFDTFGSGILEPSTGLILHDRGAAFSLDPAHPAALEGGMRPPHTLTPVLVSGPEGGIAAAVGAMGAWAQPQILTQVLIRLLDRGERPGPAVSAPRWVVAGQRHGGEPAVLAEPEAAAAVGGVFTTGPRLMVLEDNDEATGHAQAVIVRAQGLEAGSDPRADGAAAAG